MHFHDAVAMLRTNCQSEHHNIIIIFYFLTMKLRWRKFNETRQVLKSLTRSFSIQVIKLIKNNNLVRMSIHFLVTLTHGCVYEVYNFLEFSSLFDVKWKKKKNHPLSHKLSTVSLLILRKSLSYYVQRL